MFYILQTISPASVELMNMQPKALATRSSNRAAIVNVKALLRAYNVNDIINNR